MSRALIDGSPRTPVTVPEMGRDTIGEIEARLILVEQIKLEKCWSLFDKSINVGYTLGFEGFVMYRNTLKLEKIERYCFML